MPPRGFRLLGFRLPALIFLFLLRSFSPPVSAEESAPGSAVPAAEAGPATETATETSTLDLDIRTSSLLELAAWCRELGLSESGSRDELSRRLREYYRLDAERPAARAGAEDSLRAVVVESAQGTEYFTVDVVGEEYARLRGGVVVSFKDGDATHRIKAREILYNRTRNTLNAVGNVEYEKTSGDSQEFFRGESLNVDIGTWTGVFLDGVSEKSKTGEDTAYRFAADVISRAPEGVTVLSDATVTTAGEGEPYWSLAAKRIWLLPGSEWAVSGALLKVGEIPMLYIPFFYFPGDDLIFHPVLGYREREGTYFQTTTYLIGRQEASSSSEESIMSMLEGDSDEERRREGIFLRRTGKRAAADDGARLSLLLDAYANLGAYLGLEAEIPKSKLLSKAAFSLGVGFSRTIYYDSTYDYYSPFTDEQPDGLWDSSRLLFFDLPFRYRFLSSGSLSGSYGSLSWTVPFYSDPYVDQDFMDRSEDMDWLELLMQGSSSDDESEVDVLGSYTLSLSGSITPKFTALDPWIKTLSLSTVKSSLTVKTKTDSAQGTSSIYRTFFYPQTLSALSLSGSVSGTLLSFGSAAARSADAPEDRPSASAGSSLGAPRSPWPAEEGAPKQAAAPAAAEALAPPVLSQTFSSAAASSSSALQLAYTMTPSFAADLVFNTDAWDSAEDIEWDDVASVLFSAKNSGKLSASASLPNSALTVGLALNANAAWQSNAYLNEDSSSYDTEAELEAAAERNYASTYLKTTGEFTLSAKPFLSDPVWSGSTLSYSLKGTVFNTIYDGSYDDPHWSTDFGEWTDDSVTAHEASVGLAALVRDLTQSLKLSASIYPRPSELSASGAVRAWRTTTTASAAVTELEEGGSFDPITISEVVDLGSSRSFTQSIVYDPEDAEFTTLSSSLSFGNLSAAFAAKSAVGYSLDADSGWYVSDTTEELRPQTFTLSYKRSQTVPPFWKRRVNLNFSVNSGLSFDFQRYTQSSFNFSLSTTFKVNEFLDLSFSSVSKNSVVFRYFQQLPWFDLPLEIPGETNPLIDLIDSFNFFDESKRLSSGFKLKSFNLSAKHYLGDWTAELSLGLSPYLDTTSTPYAYKYETELSFLVKWTPVPELKAETSYDKDDGFVVE